MSNQFFTPPSSLAAGTKARAADVNAITQAVNSAFDKLPGEAALKGGAVNYAVNSSTTDNAYVVALDAKITATGLFDGLEVKMLPNRANTGACTLNVNGLGNIAIKRADGTDPQSGDILAICPIPLTYRQSGNVFMLPPVSQSQIQQMSSEVAAAAASAAAAAGSALDAQNQANTIRVADYASLRALTAAATAVYVTGYLVAATPSGIAGTFTPDDSDTTSADNGGTIIVATNGRRWKRSFSGPIDVRWFGAVGDNATDNYSAITGAINSLPSSGGSVYFPVGCYKTTQQVTVANKSNIRIFGPAFSGSYNATTIGATITGTGSFTGFSFSNGVGCTVESLQLSNFGAAIYFNGCLGFRVLNCNLSSNQIGLSATGNGVGIVRGNMVRSNSIAGLQFLKSSGDTVITENDIGANSIGILAASGGLHIHNNLIFYSNNSGNGIGILVDGSNVNADTVIRRVFIHNNLLGRNDLAVKLLGQSGANPNVESVTISENHIHQADDGGGGFDSSFLYGQGISVAYAKYTKVRGNQMIGLRDYAIQVSNCLTGVEIVNNNIRFGGGTGAGITCFNIQWGRIDNNDFVSNTGTAIAMTGGSGNYSQNNVISNNRFQSNGAVYTEDANSRANFIVDPIGPTLSDFSLSSTTPISQIRISQQAGNQISFKNQSIYQDGHAWNGPHLIMASTHAWFDAFRMLRSKNSAPSSDTDGSPFGLKVSVPATATSSGAPGQWAADTSYAYFYTGDGTTHSWRRVATAAW